MVVVGEQQLHQVDVPLWVARWDHDLSVTQLGVDFESLELIRPQRPRFSLLGEHILIDLTFWGHLDLRWGLQEVSEEYIELLSALVVSRAPYTPNQAEDENGFNLWFQEIQILLTDFLYLGVSVGRKITIHQARQRLREVVVHGTHNLLDAPTNILEAWFQVRIKQDIKGRGEALALLTAVGDGVQPTLDLRFQAQRYGFHVDHTTSTHGGGWCYSQILHLEHHGHVGCECKNLSTNQAQFLVVI